VADATTVALVSVVVTGATAIAAPVVTGGLEARREQRRFARERITKDFDDLRTLLDDIGTKLYTYTHAHTELEQAYGLPLPEVERIYGPPLPDEDEEEFRARVKAARTNLRAEAETRKTKMYHLRTRLEIRLGREHPVAKTFEECLYQIDLALGWIDERSEISDDFGEMGRKAEERSRVYWDGYESYTDAAHELVGARQSIAPMGVIQ
jgi:hypothetical protein